MALSCTGADKAGGDACRRKFERWVEEREAEAMITRSGARRRLPHAHYETSRDPVRMAKPSSAKCLRRLMQEDILADW